MTVFVLERVSAAVRGALTRWMLEPKTGVFVGRPSALVRGKLWEMICEKVDAGAAVMIHQVDCEQGFIIQTYGKTSRAVIDFEGLQLVRA